MNSALPHALTPALRADLEEASRLAQDADADATRHAYRFDAMDYFAFCRGKGASPTPMDPRVVVLYLVDMEKRGLAVATIRRRAAALARLALEQGGSAESMTAPSSPQVKKTLKAIARRAADRGKHPRKAKAVTGAIVATTLRDPEVSLRDRTLLAVGFACGMRRSEIAALRWVDVEERHDGLLLHIRKSKTDQEGEGQVVALPYRGEGEHDLDPARLLLRWRRATEKPGVTTVFGVSASTINRVVKAAAARAGHDPAAYSAHSLRAGLLTTAAESGVQLAEAMSASRHKDASVAAGYYRGADAMRNRAFLAAVRSIS